MNYTQKKREKRAQGDDPRRPALAREAAFGGLPETLNQSAKVQAQLQLDRSLNQPKKNDTRLPDGLRAGVEELSGLALDDVKVHYNSSQPAQLNALAPPVGARDAGVAQMGKKGRKEKPGGRSHTKKQGGKSQRDKKPGLMGDSEVGPDFTKFWHKLKQKHPGQIGDYTGNDILKLTLAELVGGESESPDANTTVYALFSRYLEDKNPKLYNQLRAAAEENEEEEEVVSEEEEKEEEEEEEEEESY